MLLQQQTKGQAILKHSFIQRLACRLKRNGIEVEATMEFELQWQQVEKRATFWLHIWAGWLRFIIICKIVAAKCHLRSVKEGVSMKSIKCRWDTILLYVCIRKSVCVCVCACVFMRGKSVMPLVLLIMLVRGTVASATCMQCTLTGLGCCCSNAIMSTTCHRPPSQQANKQVNKQTSRWKTKQINRKPKRRMADQLLLLLVG